MADPMWWAYDTDGWWPYDTREKAATAAADALAGDTKLAIEDDEWPDGVESTCWGVVLYHVVEHEVEEEVYGEPRRSVTYTLEPVPGAVEAVLELASVEQLRAELARREGYTPYALTPADAERGFLVDNRYGRRERPVDPPDALDLGPGDRVVEPEWPAASLTRADEGVS